VDDVTALSWIEKALNVSLFLVAIGVAGEFVGNWVAAPIRKRLEAAKDLEIARLAKDTADANARTAEAQLALKKSVDNLARHQGRRRLDIAAFLAPLKDKPKAKVELRYKANDSEAHLLAGQIKRWLGPGAAADGAGCEVSKPMPIPTDIGLGGSGTTTGITIVAPSGTESFRADSPLSALQNALGSGIGGGSLVTEYDLKLPKDTFVLVIGQKP